MKRLCQQYYRDYVLRFAAYFFAAVSKLVLHLNMQKLEYAVN